MAKQIWEITPQDYAVWQFPSWKDDSHEETVICQASQDDVLDPSSNIIVRAKFVDANGNEFIGLEQITVTIEGYSYVNEASATCVMSC